MATFISNHGDVDTFSRCSLNEKIPAYRDPEWQANVFGSAFLMPKELIAGLSVFEISDVCKTSIQSASIALKCAS